MLETQDSPQTAGNLLFWAAWTLGTAIAATAGIALADLPVVNMPNDMYVGDNGVGPLVLWGCGLLFWVGPLVGLAQGAALRLLLPKANVLVWALASFVGGLLAVLVAIVGVLLEQTVGLGLIMGLLFAGCGFGLAQLPLLPDYRDKNWWVIVCGIAWIGGIVAGQLVSAMLVGTAPNPPFHPAEAAVRWGVQWAVGSLVFGAITGGGLLVILGRFGKATGRDKSRPYRGNWL